MLPYIWAADAGEIASAVFVGGSIHPPGYPIFYLFSKLFLLFPVANWLSSLQVISLVSFLFGIGTFIFSFRLIGLYLAEFTGLSMAQKLFLKVLSLLITFTSWVYLLYASVPEVFTITTFFLAGMNFYLLSFWLGGKDRDQRLFILLFCLGLFHQYLLVLNLGLYFLVLLSKRIRVGRYVREYGFFWILALFVGASPYFLFYLLWDQYSLVQWEAKSFEGLLRLVFRVRYGFFNTGAREATGLLVRLGNLQTVFSSYLHTLTLPTILIAFLGMIRSFKSNRRLGLFMAVWFLLYGLFFFLYVEVGESTSFGKAILERFTLLTYPGFAVLLTMGLVWFHQALRQALDKLIHSNLLRQAIWLGFYAYLVLFASLIIYKNLSFFVIIHKNSVFVEHAKLILDTPPKRSILILARDVDLFPTQYLHLVEGYRPDLILLPYTRLNDAYYYRAIKHQYPFLWVPKEGVKRPFRAFVRRNSAKHLFFTNFSVGYAELFFSRYGVLYQLSTSESVKEEQPMSITRLNKIYALAAPFADRVWFYQVLLEQYARQAQLSANIYFRKSQFKQAVPLYEFAYQIDPQNNQLVQNYALSLNRAGKCKLAQAVLVKNFAESRSPEVARIVSNLYATCTKDQKLYLYWKEMYHQLK